MLAQLVSSKASLPSLQPLAFSLCPHVVFLCVCALLASLSYKDTGPIGSGPYDVASVNLNSLSKCPVSQYSCSEVRASIYELMWDEGGDNGAGKHRSGLNTKL